MASFFIWIKDKKVSKLSRLLKGFDKKLHDRTTNLGREAAGVMRLRWRGVAAVETGAYVNSIADEVTLPASNIVDAKAFTTIRGLNGFPFPRALEDSTRYHYRATRFKGSRTAGKATKAIKKVWEIYRDKTAEMVAKLMKELRV